MKRLLIASSVLCNVIFIIIFGYLIHNRGGFTYIKTRLGFRINNEASLARPDWYYENNPHWAATKALYEGLPNDSCEIIFIGTSITKGCEWAELFSNPKIKNRGIGGDNTEGVLERLSEITESNPSKIFIEIGTNDLALGMKISVICSRYGEIIDGIKGSSPGTKIYVQSVLPVNNDSYRSNDSIIKLNHELEKIARVTQSTFIDLYKVFLDSSGSLDMRLSTDGLHINIKGYQIWKDVIDGYVNGP
jgi:lysophospholipase L1-like esterase